MRIQQANRVELARSLSQRERRACTLAQAEVTAGWREAAEAEAERAAVVAEVRRLSTIEGTIASAVREQSKPWPWLSRRCVTALHAAQLRLVLAFLYSERLAEQCPVMLETGRMTDIIVRCWKVRPDPSPPCSF
eukprot:COSAG06_NODE_4977_length_3815_cov_2.324004_6_plen_134_part_00